MTGIIPYSETLPAGIIPDMKLTKQQCLEQMGIGIWRLKYSPPAAPTQRLLIISTESSPSFADSAQKLLDSMVATIEFNPLDVDILTISDKKLAGPKSAILQQIAKFNPSIMLITGLKISQFLLKSVNSLNDLRQTIHLFGNHKIPLIVTFHPADLLTTPKDKQKAFLDLCLLTRALATKS